MKINTNIIIGILILGFNQGLLNELNFIDTQISSLIIDFLIAIFFLLNLAKRTPFLIIDVLIILLIFVSVLSKLINEEDFISLILFWRELFTPMLFFITIVKIRIINVHLIKKIIIVLFTEQILAAIYKLIFLGSSEKIVGTISTDSGGIATLFPLIGISLTFHIYQLTKKRKYFFLTPLFLIISYLSHKMAILFYMPILFIYSIITYNKYYNNSLIFFTHLKKFIIYAPLVFVMIYFMVRLNPRANIEQKAWGSFDLYYLKNEVERYTTKNKHVAGRHYSGRFSAFNLYLKDFIDRPLPNMLIGNGPGSVIKSSFLKGNYVDFTDKFGYGAKLGSLWFLEQIGLLGLIVFVYLQLVIYSKIKTSKNNSPLLILHSRSLMLIFILDFFTYSSVFIISAPITSYYYLIIGATLIGSNKMQLMIGKDRI